MAADEVHGEDERPAPKIRPIRAALWYAFAIALLVGAFLFVYIRITLNNLQQARRSSCEAILAQLEQALAMYRLDMDFYPTTSQGLEALTKGTVHHPPYFVNRLNGEIQPRILDPWGHPFVYRYKYQGRATRFELYSAGLNGIDENGMGDDVTSD